MSLQTLLNRIDELQTAIEAEGKFDPEVLKKINYKFRLDWNYHSNAMEGNSLTKEETRSVMVNNVSVREKPLKDVLEMKGHDQIVSDILKIGKGELNISEKRIKDIHKVIIHEDDPGEKQKIGQWKTVNNHLINYKDEKFDFLDYQEVPEAMHRLINWLNHQIALFKIKSPEASHPSLIAFEFHLKYLTIHPFYDGNGRTARVLMNLILISFGYPPLIIKKDEKDIYYRYLSDIQGYGGSPDLYFEFMSKLLIHSQELVLKVIHGENIEEPDDLDKGIEVLKRTLAITPGKIEKSGEVLQKLWNESLSHLKIHFIDLHDKFKVLFNDVKLVVTAKINNQPNYDLLTSDSEVVLFIDLNRTNKITSIVMSSQLRSMVKHADYSKTVMVNISFATFSYTISSGNLIIAKEYAEPFTPDEIKIFIQSIGKSLLDELNAKSGINS